MALFYVDRLSSRGDGFNEIGLAAKERWCLEHIDNLRHWRSLFRAVNIRKNRNPNLLPNICQNRQSFFHPNPTKAGNGTSISFVKAGFIKKRNLQMSKNFFER